MVFLPLIAAAPIACAARTALGINRWLAQSYRQWRARQRESYYFSLLTEYEVDRLAKDIGVGRAELLGEQLRPNSRGSAPSLSGAGSRPLIGRKTRPMHSTDA